MSDDEEAPELAIPAWLEAETVTTNGRRLATTIAGGVVGILVGVLSVPDRALDVPVETETYGHETIYNAAYLPVEPVTIWLVLVALVNILVLWKAYEPTRFLGGDDDE